MCQVGFNVKINKREYSEKCVTQDADRNGLERVLHRFRTSAPLSPRSVGISEYRNLEQKKSPSNNER